VLGVFARNPVSDIGAKSGLKSPLGTWLIAV
jgi:hypothetical protein